jgi:hypothetical protein
MSRKLVCAALALLLAACGSPPGYRGASLGMTTEELLSARPNLKEAGEGWSSELTVFESGPSGDVTNEYYLIKDDALVVIVVLHRSEADFPEIRKRFAAGRGRPNRSRRLYGGTLLSWETWRGNTHLVKTGLARRGAVKLPLGQQVEVAGDQWLAIISSED